MSYRTSLGVAALAACSVLGLTTAATARADREVDDFTFFASPSGNISCLIAPAPVQTGAPSVRCDIRERDWSPPPRPPDCPGFTDYGQGIALNASQTPRFVCAGDTTFGNGDTLGYGDSISAGSLQCFSAESGMTCRDLQTGRGFTIARQAYDLF